jgi:hypothetical protein
MSIRCPNCKREYDVTLFEFGNNIKCICGEIINLSHYEYKDDLDGLLKKFEIEVEEEKISRIKRESNKIASHILDPDYPKVDIEIEKKKFKDLIREEFPDKVHLYDLIYEPRFRRLEEQFRKL